MSILISVVIPVYQVAPYIRVCLDSVVSQTHRQLEVIIIDDGSADDCGKICDEYALCDSRIVAIHKKNGGLSDARNHGLVIATGSYYLFVDSDDILSRKLAEITSFTAEDTGAEIVRFSYKDFTAFPDHTDVARLQANPLIRSGREATRDMLMTSGDIVVWNKLYKANCFQNHRFKNGYIHEDEFISYKIVYEAKTVAYVDSVLYYYRLRDQSVSHSGFSLKKLVLIEAFEERICYFAMHGDKELEDISIGAFYNILRTLWVVMDREKTNYAKEKKLVFRKIRRHYKDFISCKSLSSVHKLIICIMCVCPACIYIYNAKRKIYTRLL